MEKLKFRVESPEHSKQIQKRLFEMGYRWSGHNDNGYIYTNKPFLYAEVDGKLSYGNTLSYFEDGSPEFKETTLKKILKESQRQIKTKKKSKMKKLFHTFEINNRQVTIAVVPNLEQSGVITVGYSVCMPQDVFDEELSKKISEGRAYSKNALFSYNLDEELMSDYSILKMIATRVEKKVRENPDLIKGLRFNRIEANREVEYSTCEDGSNSFVGIVIQREGNIAYVEFYSEFMSDDWYPVSKLKLVD